MRCAVEPPKGRSSAARVSRGTEFDIWKGLGETIKLGPLSGLVGDIESF